MSTTQESDQAYMKICMEGLVSVTIFYPFIVLLFYSP